jgi:membrane-associated phospholipid phosphatase
MSVSPHAYPSRVIIRAGSPPSRPKLGAPAGALGVALLCVFALAATWCAAALVPSVHTRDAYALFDFTQLQRRADVAFAAEALLDLLNPVTATLWACLLVAVALRRGLPRVALAVALVMGLAPLSADILKPLLAHSHAVVAEIHVNAASWPSGHATAALTLALCAVLVAPARLRPAVLSAGLLFAAAIGVALVILAWHMPSDVFGGYLLASLWMSLAVAALRASERRWPLPVRS